MACSTVNFTFTWCIPVKNTLSWIAVIPCEGSQSYSVRYIFLAFCVVRATHKFDFRLFINWTPSKEQPAENNKKLMFLTGCRSFLCTWAPTHNVNKKAPCLSNVQYFQYHFTDNICLGTTSNGIMRCQLIKARMMCEINDAWLHQSGPDR